MPRRWMRRGKFIQGWLLGDRSVAIGGNVIGSPIIVGNDNVIQSGKYNIKIDDARGVAIGDNARVQGLYGDPTTDAPPPAKK
jgi:hypothetical protein